MSDAARSVARIAALLELFERERRPLTSQEIAGQLAIPRSSLGTLLKSLAGLGWLAVDRRRATYFPGARLARLTGWLQGASMLDDRLRDAVERLRQETGETVSVSVVSDLEIEVIHVSSADVGIQLVVHPGRRMPLWTSGVGTAYLATLPDATIRSMHARARRRVPDGEALPPLAEALQQVRLARKAGMSFADAAVVPDVAAYAVGLPDDIGPRPMVLSVGGPSSRVMAARTAIEAALAGAVAALAPSLAPAPAPLPAPAPAPLPSKAGAADAGPGHRGGNGSRSA